MFRSRSRWIIRKPLRARARVQAGFPRAAVAWACVLSWLTIACACVGGARAQDDRELVLAWQADTACPDGAWALARVSERLGRPLARASGDALRATATLTHEGDRFVLALHTEQGESRGDRAL